MTHVHTFSQYYITVTLCCRFWRQNRRGVLLLFVSRWVCSLLEYIFLLPVTKQIAYSHKIVDNSQCYLCRSNHVLLLSIWFSYNVFESSWNHGLCKHVIYKTSGLTMYQLLSSIVYKSEILLLLFNSVRIFSEQLLNLEPN